jgi:hypothetical protein
MPSHSKKQHNFMEAIAHSPSFAKKVHIPQSVGKDYAAADKGKTFKRGGDMKGYADGGMPMVNKGGKMVPSFAADGVGKMAKGGMASKMKMFEKSGKDIEKKGMKEGSKADKALDKKQMMGMKAGGRVRRMAGGGMGDPFDLNDTDRENYAKNGAENLKRLKGFFGFGDREATPSMTMDKIPPSSGAGVDRPTASSAPANGGRRPLPVSSASSQSPRTRREGEDTSDSDAVEREDAAARASRTALNEADKQKKNAMDAFNPALADAQKQKENAMAAFKPKPRKPIGVEKTVKQERVITAPNDNSYASMEERRAKASESKMLDKKPGAMTRQMREAPTIDDLYKGQKSMSDEIGDALKSFRSSIRGGLKSAAEKRQMREAEAHVAKGGRIKAYAEGGKVKKMRYGGSPEDGMDMGQPMRGGPRPAPVAPEAPMNPNSIAYLQSKYGMRPQGGNDMNLPMNPRMKAGGSVKKMAEGGFTREADGIAKKGKTQGKVVKMAKGGFVKNADGCAQRGKTKAFQVKMKNGGMC